MFFSIAREGLLRVMQSPKGKMARWDRLGKHYRHLLYQPGVREPDRNRGGFDAERIKEVLAGAEN